MYASDCARVRVSNRVSEVSKRVCFCDDHSDIGERLSRYDVRSTEKSLDRSRTTAHIVSHRSSPSTPWSVVFIAVYTVQYREYIILRHVLPAVEWCPVFETIADPPCNERLACEYVLLLLYYRDGGNAVQPYHHHEVSALAPRRPSRRTTRPSLRLCVSRSSSRNRPYTNLTRISNIVGSRQRFSGLFRIVFARFRSSR